MKTKRGMLLLFVVMVSFIFGACNKDKDLVSHMTVKMTDAPARFESVNVEIKEFHVHYANAAESEAWVSLPVNAGVYDLLTLQNDITTTLVSDAEIRVGYINQVRLVLGENNSVVLLDGMEYELIIPSGMETGIKINLGTEVTANNAIEVVLDFDASASVILEGNGTYSLKPVITVKSVSQI